MMASQRRRFAWLLVAALALPFPAACAKAPDSEEQAMKAGLEALYTRRDPEAAAGYFRKVLERNPNHYGATFQLAMALDQAGRKDEARPVWQRALTMAEAAQDAETVATARTRLAAGGATAGSATAGSATGAEAAQAELMRAGLDLLYQRNDPVGAAARFRQVLERNPNHYGATFQLGMALDRAGKPAEARPLWEKVVKMAEGYGDKETVATARARLARRP